MLFQHCICCGLIIDHVINETEALGHRVIKLV